jgi:hypothetical protein
MVAVFRGFGLEEQEPISKENPVNFNLDDKPCYEKGNIHSVCTAARSGELQIRLNGKEIMGSLLIILLTSELL